MPRKKKHDCHCKYVILLGPTGSQGPGGPTGSETSGAVGPTGTAGLGVTGPTGIVGMGVTGPTGPAGLGVTGPTGLGVTGPTSPAVTGPTGPPGLGVMGPTGPPDRGVTGPTGPLGLGVTGPTGPPGQGVTGPIGIPGVGVTGPTGPTGQGPTGPSGLGVTGPIGPTGSPSFGSVYSTLSQGLSGATGVSVATGQVISFDEFGPSSGVTTSSAGVGIDNSGVYQINYMATLYANMGYTGSNYNSIALVSESGTYTIVPYSTVSGYQNQLSGSIRSRLSQGQVLSIANLSNDAAYLPSSPSVTLSYSTSNYSDIGGTMVFNGLPLYTNMRFSFYVAVQAQQNPISSVNNGSTPMTLIASNFYNNDLGSYLYYIDSPTSTTITIKSTTEGPLFGEVMVFTNTIYPSPFSTQTNDGAISQPYTGVNFPKVPGNSFALLSVVSNATSVGNGSLNIIQHPGYLGLSAGVYLAPSKENFFASVSLGPQSYVYAMVGTLVLGTPPLINASLTVQQLA
ncbi:MAG: hypothetical protein ACYCQJ_14375 [Nitrososphaerales archaeon]